jgi:glycosyltransferase involved in cell wall biosynthesis
MNRPEAQEKTSVTCTDAAHTMPVNSLTLPETTSGTHPTFQLGLVSVMMPAFNAERFIAEAIESVLNQVYPNWELIIVNDGSTDQTAEIISRFSDSRIVVIHQPNRGEASARNLALEYSRGEFIAFLDADDLYQSNHLEMTIAYLQAWLDRDAVYTDGYHINGDGTLLQPLSARRRGPFEGHIFEEVVRASDVFGPPGCGVIRSRLVFQNRLTFDTNIVIGPDWDFLAQCADVAQFGYLNQPTYLYRIHQANISAITSNQTRTQSLIRCRSKAIKMINFGTCSLEVQRTVFYDLLVNLLHGKPDQQADIIHWPEFTALPSQIQAQLLRLMASKAIMDGRNHLYIREWIQLSQKLNGADYRVTWLARFYQFSPWMCRHLLRLKASLQLKVSDPALIWQ